MPTIQDLSDLVVCVIGGGLIGGSIVRELRAQDCVKEIRVYDANESHRIDLRDIGAAHVVPETLKAAVDGADMVIFCVPVGRIVSAAQEASPYLKDGCIVSDVGSTKEHILADLTASLPAHVHIIPAHPVAGTEKSGPHASLTGLFQDRWCILTPPEDAAPSATDTTIRLWRAMGARVSVMDAKHHDRVLGMTSHLPHLIAYTIVGTAKDLEDITQSEVIKYSAGGFRDFTRIAASDPIMWRDIFLNNKDAILELLQQFKTDLQDLEGAIQNDDGAKLESFFTRTRNIRRQIVDAKQGGGPGYFGDDAPLLSPYAVQDPTDT